VIYEVAGEFPLALQNNESALQIARSVGDRRTEGVVLNNLGALYARLGNRQKAIDLLLASLPLRRDLSDREGEAATLENLGNAYADLQQGQKALDHYPSSGGSVQRAQAAVECRSNEEQHRDHVAACE